MSTATHPDPASRGPLGSAALVALCACLLSLPAWSGQVHGNGVRDDARDSRSDSRRHLFGTANIAAAPHASGPMLLAAADDPMTLDLKRLEQHLVDTKAIGFLAKLSLKGKLDGFVKDLRAAHGGEGKHTLEDMHERYDLLVHNVLAMLEKMEPQLAGEIAAAREPLWALLADVEKFEQTIRGKA